MIQPVRETCRSTLATILVCLTLAPALAGEPTLATVEVLPGSALALALEDFEGEPLQLEDAVAAGLAGATAIEIARSELESALAAERRERGAFDPELFGEIERLSDAQPTASFFSGADVLETDETRFETGARITLPTGTRLTASLNNSRLTTNSGFATLSPLLKGFGPGARGDLDAARRLRERAEILLEQARVAVRAEVESVYWELFAAERDYAVRLLIRDQAQALLAEAELRARAGLVGPSDVASAQVFLAEQRQAVLDQEERLDQLSDRLATLMGRRPSAGAPRYRTRDLPPEQPPVIPLPELLDLVEARNADLRAGEQLVAAARTRARAAGWNALPALDLFGGLGGNGLAGRGRDIVLDFGEGPPDTLRGTLDTGFGDSFAQVRRRDYPTWNVGVRVAIPLGGRADGAEHDRLRAEADRAEQQLEATRRALEETVRAQHRELERGQRRLEIARDGVDASLEQVRIGLLEFKNGRTTTFELVRLGADLAAAQQRYSQALVRSARAVAALRQLTGGAWPGHANTTTQKETDS
jgi:outer membrane protein TolC